MCACAEVEADIAWLPDQVGRMYINMVQDALKEGKRAGRLALLESDAVLEVFRRHKSQLRMQLLAGSPQQRNSILRAAFLVRERSLHVADIPFFCSRFRSWAVRVPAGAVSPSLDHHLVKNG